jgi:hypothetical protein
MKAEQLCLSWSKAFKFKYVSAEIWQIELWLSLGPSVVEKVVDSWFQYDNDMIQPMPTLASATRYNR